MSEEEKEEKPKKPKKEISKLRAFIGGIAAIILVVIACAFTFGWLQTFEIVSESMMPTLRVGDYLVVNTSEPIVPEMGDVVVARHPDHPQHWFCKRVVGMPNEIIEFRKSHLYINGKSRSNSEYGLGTLMSVEGNYRVKLAHNEYFVLGDHQMASLDSRDFGPLKADDFIGIVNCVYWPLDSIKIINRAMLPRHLKTPASEIK